MSLVKVSALVLLTVVALTSAVAAAPRSKVPGATRWYVPGISEAYPPSGSSSNSSFYYVLNPGTKAGLVTLTLLAPDGTQVCSISDTVASTGQILLFSFVCNAARSDFEGYAVVTSEVPVLVQANEADGLGNRHLDAYPVE